MRYVAFGFGALLIALVTFVVAMNSLPQPTTSERIRTACIGEADVQGCETHEYALANARLLRQRQADIDREAGN